MKEDDEKTTARIVVVSVEMGVAELKVWLAERLKGEDVRVESMEIYRDSHTYRNVKSSGAS